MCKSHDTMDMIEYLILLFSPIAKISIRPVKSRPTSTKARSHHKMNKQTTFQRKGHSRMLVNRSSPRLNKDGIICRINMKELRKRKYEHHVKMALTKKVKVQLTPLNVDNLPKRKTPTARKTTDNKHSQRDRQKTTSKTKRRLISYKDYKSSIKQPSVLPLQKKSTSIVCIFIAIGIYNYSLQLYTNPLIQAMMLNLYEIFIMHELILDVLLI